MTTAPVFRAALIGGAAVAAVVAVVGGLVGLVAAGAPGLFGALVGTLLAAVFLGLTAVSMLVAARVARGDLTSPAFFGVVLGVWFVKIVVFVVAALWLRGQDWLNPWVFFFCVLAAVIGSLVVDCVAVARSRVPYASDVTLPGDEARAPRV